jgi:hypothetical protein
VSSELGAKAELLFEALRLLDKTIGKVKSYGDLIEKDFLNEIAYGINDPIFCDTCKTDGVLTVLKNIRGLLSRN